MFTSLALSCLLTGLLPCAMADTAVGDKAVVVAPALAPMAAAPAAPWTGAELVTVTYDLERIWAPPAQERYAMRTIPFRFVHDGIEPGFEEWDASFPVDHLVDFLWNVVAPGEFDYEGRALNAVGRNGLQVTAPTSVQSDVRATLDFLAASMQRRARLDIDLWRTTGDGVLPDAMDAAALSAAESAGTLLRLAGRHEELPLGRTERRSAVRETRYLRDWNPEIAQQSSMESPQFETLETGTTLLLRLDAQDEEHVAFRFVQQLSELRAMEHRSEALRATIHTDSGNTSDVVAGVLDQPVVAFATLAGSALLAPGDDLLTVGHAQTLDGPVGYVVRYRLVSVDPAPAPMVLGGTPSRDVRAIDVSQAMWPALSADAPTPHQYFAGHEDASGLDLTWLVFPSAERHDPGEIMQLAFDSLGDDGAADRTVWDLGSVVIAGGDAGSTERVRAALAAHQPTRRALTLQLEVLESGRASPGRTVARATLPLSTGNTGVAVVGCARMLLTSFDVDVAQGAAVPDPVVAGCFDGLALRARAADDGSVSLDLLDQRVLHRERVDLRVPTLMPVDQVELARVSLSPRLLPDGQWHSQPDVAGGFDGTQLELRWRLVAR